MFKLIMTCGLGLNYFTINQAYHFKFQIEK